MESRVLESFLKLGIGVLVVLLFNGLSQQFFFRADLTEEQRFSISPATMELLASLEDDVYVEVYLEGDLPSGFRRLRNATEEVLQEFRVRSGDKINFTFVDPQQGASAKAQNEFMMSIAQKGIQPTDVNFMERGQRIQKRILPGAVISYGAREKGVLLLKGNLTAPSEVRLNQSVEGVEFELANAIRTLTKAVPETIGISTGHEEMGGVELADFRSALEEVFIVKPTSIDKSSLADVDVLLLIKPRKAISLEEQFALDQYIMTGGNVIFMIDALMASMDSTSISIPYELGLDDILFRYGLRINKDLVLDMLSVQAPVVIGNLGEAPQIELLQWPFYPLISTYGDHPVVRNLDAVRLKFASSLDTVKADGIRKIPLIMSSIRSRSILAPIIIDLDELKKPMNPADFAESNIPMAYLLEGQFTSAFKNRPLPEGQAQGVEVGEETKIAVIADGDFAANEVDPQSGRSLPLGFDPYSRSGITYANKEFLLNLINYMIDDEGLVLSRNKEVVLRPLDKQKIAESRMAYQVVNMLAPLVFLALFGWGWNFIRKKKYSRF